LLGILATSFLFYPGQLTSLDARILLAFIAGYLITNYLYRKDRQNLILISLLSLLFLPSVYEKPSFQTIPIIIFSLILIPSLIVFELPYSIEILLLILCTLFLETLTFTKSSLLITGAVLPIFLYMLFQDLEPGPEIRTGIAFSLLQILTPQNLKVYSTIFLPYLLFFIVWLIKKEIQKIFLERIKKVDYPNIRICFFFVLLQLLLFLLCFVY